MIKNLPEWAYLVDETGRYWYHLGNGERQTVPEGAATKAPGKSLFGIATNDLVSIPQWVSSKDNEIISQVVAMEVAKLGVNRSLGPGKVSDWKAVEHNGTRTLVQSVSTPWTLDELDKSPSRGDFVDFYPQYALFSPPENAAVLWREGLTWVAGYSRGHRWVHVQTLGGDEIRDALGGEINLTLIELSAKGLLDGTDRVVVWSNYDIELHRALQDETGLIVDFEARPAPSPLQAPEWDFEPHDVTRARLGEARRRQGIWLTVLALVVVAALVSAAYFHLWSLGNSNAALLARIEANREGAAVIESAMERWQELSPAIDPRRSPVELFHQISLLLPEKGLRITTFEIQNNRSILIRAEGSTMANALQIKGAFEKAESLADYEWEIPPPRTKDDVTEIFATGTYRY
jgi:hypothetical protein